MSQILKRNSLGLPELLEGLRKHESDRDHHHDGLGEQPHATLVELTGVHRRPPEREVAVPSTLLKR